MHEKKELTLQPSFGDERGRLQKLNYCLMGRVWVSWHQPTIPDYQGFSLLLGLVIVMNSKAESYRSNKTESYCSNFFV